MRNIGRIFGFAVFLKTGLAVLAFAAFIPCDAAATSVVHRTVQEMTRVSELVISGVVANVDVNQTTRSGLPATGVKIDVFRVIKGYQTSESITFTIPGGVRDGMELRIPGMASFKAGEEVVVFLERTPTGWIPSGLANGKYAVKKDDSGRRIAFRRCAALERIAVNRTLTAGGESESDVLTFDELLLMIDEGLELERLEKKDVVPVDSFEIRRGAR